MRKHVGITRTRRVYAAIVLAACAAILSLYLCWRRQPPDLKACTRIEVQYADGALDYFFPGQSMQERVLSEEEKAHIRSFDTWTVTDQEQIRAFADHIRQGRYRGRLFGVIGDTPTDVICYQASDRVASFAAYRRGIVTKGRREFTYAPGFLNLRSLDPPAIKPLKGRWECATNLSAMVFEGLWLGRKRHSYPDPNHWCDAIVEAYREKFIIYKDQNGKRERMYPDSRIARRFACPGIHAPTDVDDARSQPGGTDPSSQTPDNWISDYAMNSNCREDSADDMVFLFESQPGWNQHGGPELFTFDNHDPRGGCVLFNDGTVKFVRSEEELHALRWE